MGIGDVQRHCTCGFLTKAPGKVAGSVNLRKGEAGMGGGERGYRYIWELQAVTVFAVLPWLA